MGFESGAHCIPAVTCFAGAAHNSLFSLIAPCVCPCPRPRPSSRLPEHDDMVSTLSRGRGAGCTTSHVPGGVTESNRSHCFPLPSPPSHMNDTAQSFLGLRQTADIDVILDGADSRKMAEMKAEDGKKEKHYLYFDGESVSGKINVTLRKPGVKLEHQGIKVEFVGEIELYQDRGNHQEFTSLVKDLARPGDLTQNSSYSFEFVNVEKPYESYTGSNVRLRYSLRVTISRRLADIVREVELLVHTLSSYPEVNSPIKMEVGIEDCLHIEFEYNKSKYHLKDVIVGKIYFLLVRIKIKHMEIAIIKRETTGIGQNTFNENETIAKYEIMDGAPVRGESIPIRLFLAGYELTPTMKDINKKFSVRYYLNLVLVDEEERRYFKQQEIVLWRKGDRTRRQIQQQPQLTVVSNVQDALHSDSQPAEAVVAD